MKRLGRHRRIQSPLDDRRSAFPCGNVGDNLAHVGYKLFTEVVVDIQFT